MSVPDEVKSRQSEQGDSVGEGGGEGGGESGLPGVLQTIAKGLMKYPPLLIAFGAIIAVVVALQLNARQFVPAVVTIVVILVLGLATWVLSRNDKTGVAERGQTGRPENGAHANVDLKKVRNLLIEDGAVVKAPDSGSASADIRLRNVDRTVLRGVAKIVTSPDQLAAAPPTATPPPAPVAQREAPTIERIEAPPALESAVEPEPVDTEKQQFSRRYLLTRDRILAAARQRRVGRSQVDGKFQIVAESGFGKSKLLHELIGELEELGFVTLFTPIAPPLTADADDSSKLDRVLRTRSAYSAVLAGLAEEVDRAGNGGVRELTDADRVRFRENLLVARTSRPENRIDISTSIHMTNVKNSPMTDAANVDLTIVAGQEAERAHTALDAMGAEAAAALAEIAAHAPLAVLIDDLHWLLDIDGGEWLAEMLAQVPNVLVITARWPGAAQLDALGETVELDLFTEDETIAYLTHELEPHGWWGAAVAQAGKVVHRNTAGRPVDVATAGQLIVDEKLDPTDDLAAMESGIGGIFASGDTAHHGVRKAVDRLAGELAELGHPVEVFDQIAVLRRFTPDLLVEVLADRIEQSAAQRLYEWLGRTKYTADLDADPEKGQRLHDRIRLNAEADLRRSPQSWQRLHILPEKFYREERLNFDSALDSESIFVGCARYEDPEWQQDSREWVYHAAQLPKRDFLAGPRAGLIRLFFELYWWWEAEVPGSYCSTLLADISTLPRELRGDWADRLEEFRRGYVSGVANQKLGQDAERWRLTQDAVTALWSALGLRAHRPPADPNLLAIYVISCCLQADAIWFGSRGLPADRRVAASWYRMGASGCTTEATHWIGSWAMVLEGQLWVGTEPDRARELLRDIPARVMEDEDNELRAEAVLLYGDIAWYSGQYARAFDIYARAVLHAFIYHVRQESPDQAPSAYTVSSYASFVATLQERLREARESADPALAALPAVAEVRMREFFDPYWDRVGGEPAQDNPAGIPPQPTDGELNRTVSPFANTIRWLIVYMADRLEEELDAPLEGLSTPWPDEAG